MMPTWRKYLVTNISKLILNTSSFGTTPIDKMLNGLRKAYCEFENNYKLAGLWLWDKTKLVLGTLVTAIILYGCEVWGI